MAHVEHIAALDMQNTPLQESESSLVRFSLFFRRRCGCWGGEVAGAIQLLRVITGTDARTIRIQRPKSVVDVLELFVFPR
jgi:hypothetical protein